MACLLAKRLGARRVFALINRKAYADLVQSTQIDIAISPAHAVIGELLTNVRRGDIEAVHSLRHGAAEALEAVVRGDRKTCKVAGRRVDEIGLPEGAQIGVDRAHAQRCRRDPGSDHSAPRHDDPDRRPCDRVRAAQAHGARHREAVPGQRRVRFLTRHDGFARRRRAGGTPRGAVRAADGRAAGVCRRRRDDGGQRAFVVATLATGATGLALSLSVRRFRRELQPRDGFLLVAMTWVLLAGLRCPAAADRDARPERDRCLLRGDVRLHRDRGHGAERARRAPDVGQRVALPADAGGRIGHHRAGSGHPAAVGRRWQPVVPH